MRFLSFITLLSVLCHAEFAEAGAPLWHFTPDRDFPPVISLRPSETALVKYVITNNTRRSHRLIMQPIKGVSKSAPCVLNPLGTCVFVLTVPGTAVMDGPIQGGPALCEANPDDSPNPVLCFKPDAAHQLNITRGEIPALSGLALSAGTYVDLNGDLRPLLAMSRDQGTSWTYPASINNVVFTPYNLRPYVSSAYLNAVSCNSGVCIASGLYASTSGFFPLLAFSTNQGIDWTYPSSIPNVVAVSYPFDSGYFTGATCKDNLCLAVGQYSSGASIYPLVASSNNNGSSWTYSTAADQVAFVNFPTSNYSTLSSVSCSASLCIVTGTYKDNMGVFRPLLAQSPDNGATWTYSSVINDPHSGSYYDNGNLSRSYCGGSACFAVGNYREAIPDLRLLLAQSLDNGVTWTYPAGISAPTFIPDNVTNPYGAGGNGFNDIHCSGSLCIAPGYYEDTNLITRPLLAITTDGGLNWSYPSAINAVSFTIESAINHPFAADGRLVSGACSGNTCMAAGYYTDTNGIMRPLLAITSDAGTTWHYPSSLTEPRNLSHPFSYNGAFQSIHCSANVCTASGYYTDTNHITRPLMAISKNLGLVWTYNSEIPEVNFTSSTTPHLFLDQGLFFSIQTGSGFSSLMSSQCYFNSANSISMLNFPC